MRSIKAVQQRSHCQKCSCHTFAVARATIIRGRQLYNWTQFSVKAWPLRQTLREARFHGQNQKRYENCDSDTPKASH
jgi:hypothetical protein